MVCRVGQNCRRCRCREIFPVAIKLWNNSAQQFELIGHWFVFAGIVRDQTSSCADLLAGLHLERRLVFIGAVLAGGYLLTLFLPEYRFTTAGVLIALALAVQALRGSGAGHAKN